MMTTKAAMVMVAAGVVLAATVSYARPPILLPLPRLKAVLVSDLDADGTLDGDDVDIALVQCQPGCNLVFLPMEEYKSLKVIVDGTRDLSQGFALVGYGDYTNTEALRCCHRCETLRTCIEE